MYESQEEYNQREREYIEAKEECRNAKDEYELTKAQVRTSLRVKATFNNEKPTTKDLDDAVLLEQGNEKSELYKAFYKYSIALSKKEKAMVEKDIAARKYWDDKT